jgi:hypothetical protein
MNELHGIGIGDKCKFVIFIFNLKALPCQHIELEWVSIIIVNILL